MQHPTVTEPLLNYPISTVLDSLQESLANGHTVLKSPTGSGKTTIAPIALLDQDWLEGKVIYMLEPRRVAARAAAYRISSLLGERVGQTAGYITRYSKKISADTKIFIVTEGVFLKTIQNDQELSNIGLVIFDEYHERSLIADLCLALCLDLAILREDIRLLVMSATLDSEKLAKLLGNARIVESAGKSFPVSVIYKPPVTKFTPLSMSVTSAISYGLVNYDGDILVFLPGIREIKAVERELNTIGHNAKILPLYGDLPIEQQDKILAPKQNNQRRVVLATPVAETSLTVDGVRCIVDSGLHKHPLYNPKSGLTSLVTSKISRASAEQRRGRAGRQKSGMCIRLWDEKVQHSLLAFTPPEIGNADLTSLVLELSNWGVNDAKQLKWLDPPGKGAWKKAVKILTQLNALNKNGQITDIGRELRKFPLHPRLSHMLIRATELSLGLTGCYLAGLLSERDLFHGHDNSIDIRDRIKALAAFSNRSLIHSQRKNLNAQVCKQILQQVEQWRKKLGISQTETITPEETGNLLCFCYPDRIAIQRSQKDSTFQLANGRQARITAQDSLNNSPMIVASKVDVRGGNGKIFLAAPITLKELENNHPHLISTSDHIRWEKKELAVQARRDSCIGLARISSKPISLKDKDAALTILMEGIQKAGSEVLPWSKSSRELQARLQTLFNHDQNNWQDFSDESLMQDLAWLEPFCYGFTKAQHLRNIDFQSALLSKLSYNKQQQLHNLVPTHTKVPSGSNIRITYHLGAEPTLAIRLQEVFGMRETPTICGGSLPLTLHLLSPARRPMQITKDLKSFWQRTYPEIKKELAGRYPKHYWPDNPLAAQATSKTKRKM